MPNPMLMALQKSRAGAAPLPDATPLPGAPVPPVGPEPEAPQDPAQECLAGIAMLNDKLDQVLKSLNGDTAEDVPTETPENGNGD